MTVTMDDLRATSEGEQVYVDGVTWTRTASGLQHSGYAPIPLDHFEPMATGGRITRNLPVERWQFRTHGARGYTAVLQDGDEWWVAYTVGQNFQRMRRMPATELVNYRLADRPDWVNAASNLWAVHAEALQARRTLEVELNDRLPVPRNAAQGIVNEYANDYDLHADEAFRGLCRSLGLDAPTPRAVDREVQVNVTGQRDLKPSELGLPEGAVTGTVEWSLPITVHVSFRPDQCACDEVTDDMVRQVMEATHPGVAFDSWERVTCGEPHLNPL